MLNRAAGTVRIRERLLLYLLWVVMAAVALHRIVLGVALHLVQGTAARQGTATSADSQVTGHPAARMPLQVAGLAARAMVLRRQKSHMGVAASLAAVTSVAVPATGQTLALLDVSVRAMLTHASYTEQSMALLGLFAEPTQAVHAAGFLGMLLFI